MTAPNEPTGHLTPRQLHALRQSANGYTSRQIANRLGVTEAAIDLRLKAAGLSLGARSRTHAVALAIITGLITAADIHLTT